jgi:hypothetical protein
MSNLKKVSTNSVKAYELFVSAHDALVTAESKSQAFIAIWTDSKDKLSLLSGMFHHSIALDKEQNGGRPVLKARFVKDVRQWLSRKTIKLSAPSGKVLKFSVSKGAFFGNPDKRAQSSATNAPKAKGKQSIQALTDSKAKVEVLQIAADAAKTKAVSEKTALIEDHKNEIAALKIRASLEMPTNARQAFDLLTKYLSKKELSKLDKMIAAYLHVSYPVKKVVNG